MSLKPSRKLSLSSFSSHCFDLPSSHPTHIRSHITAQHHGANSVELIHLGRFQSCQPHCRLGQCSSQHHRICCQQVDCHLGPSWPSLLTRSNQLLHTGFSKAITTLKSAKLASSSSRDHPSIVAGSADGSIAVWQLRDGRSWAKVHVIKAAHQGSVSALGVVRSQAEPSLPSVIVSGASDGLLKVWLLSGDTASQSAALVQTIDLKGRFPLDLSLLPLPNNTTEASSAPQLLMALATPPTRLISLFQSHLSIVSFSTRSTARIPAQTLFRRTRRLGQVIRPLQYIHCGRLGQ